MTERNEKRERCFDFVGGRTSGYRPNGPRRNQRARSPFPPICPLRCLTLQEEELRATVRAGQDATGGPARLPHRQVWARLASGAIHCGSPEHRTAWHSCRAPLDHQDHDQDARDKTLIWTKRAHSSAQPTLSPQLEGHVSSRGNLFTSLDEDPPEGRPCDGRKGMVRC